MWTLTDDLWKKRTSVNLPRWGTSLGKITISPEKVNVDTGILNIWLRNSLWSLVCFPLVKEYWRLVVMNLTLRNIFNKWSRKMSNHKMCIQQSADKIMKRETLPKIHQHKHTAFNKTTLSMLNLQKFILSRKVIVEAINKTLHLLEYFLHLFTY